MIIRVWRLLLNEFCLHVFTSKDLQCRSLSVTPPLVRPWTRPTSGIVPCLTPRKPVSHCLSKNLLSVRLYSPIHACWPWFRLKSTKMSTQPFISFHRKSSYLSTSSHLRSWWRRYAAVLLSHVQLSAAPGTAACQAPVHADHWLTLLSSLRPHSSSPSSCSPKARVSIETKVEYAAEFQESRQEKISVGDKTKIMKQQRHSEEKDSRKKPLEIKVWEKKKEIKVCMHPVYQPLTEVFTSLVLSVQKLYEFTTVEEGSCPSCRT